MRYRYIKYSWHCSGCPKHEGLWHRSAATAVLLCLVETHADVFSFTLAVNVSCFIGSRCRFDSENSVLRWHADVLVHEGLFARLLLLLLLLPDFLLGGVWG